MKHHNLLSSTSSRPKFGESSQGDIIKKYSFSGEGMMDDEDQNVQNEKVTSMSMLRFTS